MEPGIGHLMNLHDTAFDELLASFLGTDSYIVMDMEGEKYSYFSGETERTLPKELFVELVKNKVIQRSNNETLMGIPATSIVYRLSPEGKAYLTDQMSVTGTITLRQAMDMGVWDKFCEVMGLNPYCINEGADENASYSVTKRDAARIGIKNVGWTVSDE
jgi:hypothetical protein